MYINQGVAGARLGVQQGLVGGLISLSLKARVRDTPPSENREKKKRQ